MVPDGARRPSALQALLAIFALAAVLLVALLSLSSSTADACGVSCAGLARGTARDQEAVNLEVTHELQTQEPTEGKQAVRRAKFSGFEESHGVVLHLDRHLARRRRRRDVRSLRRKRGVRGVARDCGHRCSLRLSGQNTTLLVHFHVFRQLPLPHNRSLHDFENGDVAALVQVMDSDDNTSAKVADTNADCIYRARVHQETQSTIVNLCDSDGLYGILQTSHGTYTVEPSVDDGPRTGKLGRRVRHMLHQIKPHRFRAYDYVSVDGTPVDQLDVEEPITSSSGPVPTDVISSQPINITYEFLHWEDVNKRHTRSRRSAQSWDHYVEVFVVADSKMYEYHRQTLESYVLTLFSTVASIYRHQSLRAAINIVVVRILILKTEYAGPTITNNAQESLKNFCRWQEVQRGYRNDDINRFDVAVLLTRKDICRAPGKCDTLGLAELGTMCDRKKSCAIIEDNGLSAAFTIAHELGHLFNIPHDDERKCAEHMQLNKENYHIMAPTLEYNTHPWSWSACSSAMLERFLERRSQLECLFDQPIERKYYDEMFEHDAPGRRYDVNQQCKFVFGEHAELCPYMPTCRRLWCSIHYGSQLGCRTQHMPWADGTPCDKHGQMYCHRGECVGMAPERRVKHDGQWGEWGPFGQCSRTCGGGVQKSVRDCDSPRPSNGGKYCVGDRERYRSCNFQECPWDTPGFREVQCAEFNNKDVRIHGIPHNSTWAPKVSEHEYGVASNERCKLYCRVQGSPAFYMLRDKVTDGTTCDRNSDDICIDGVCHQAGCDHILKSQAKRDECGICGGDGSRCIKSVGNYNDRGTYGYNEILKIPAGAANIDITQSSFSGTKDDDNYLALKSASGEYLLNGEYQVSVFKQFIPIQDVFLEYSGSDAPIERINGTGPIRTDVYLHILSVGKLNPPNIRYEFHTVNKSTNVMDMSMNQMKNHYYWRFERWSDCTRECQGDQYEEYICVEARHNRKSDERNCRAQPPRAKSRRCNLECTARWQTEDLSSCVTRQARCGHGEKNQKVYCAKIDVNGRAIPTNERECSGQNRPPARVGCYVDCTGHSWSYSEWTQCSATCGSRGVQRRNIFCIDSQSRQVNFKMCESQMSREPTERECNRIPCPRWTYGEWSECTKSCDGGVRRRHAFCVDGADRELPIARCDVKEKQVTEHCNEHECTWWEFDQWSECNAKCGNGNRTREAFCRTRNGRVDDSRCDIRQRIVSKVCALEPCPSWIVGEWSPCNSCRDQWSMRTVDCRDYQKRKLKDQECEKYGGRKPDTHRECNSGPCPFWKIGDWSACSVTCGNGRRARTVTCIDRQVEVDDSYCGDAKPPLSQDCVLLPCAQWDPQAWSSCSVTCGSGSQKRQVFCRRSNTIVLDRECDAKSRPRTQRTCTRESCPDLDLTAKGEYQIDKKVLQKAPEPTYWWATGPWSVCTEKCGKGTQRRQVKCRNKDRDLPEEYCSHLERVDAQRVCMVRPCARWEPAPWRPCPVTCGSHVNQEREVKCVPVSANSASEPAITVTVADCDVALRPILSRPCNLPHCPRADPPLGFWITRTWTECSVSCGGGWRSRHVSCSKAACDERTKPSDVEKCNVNPCPTLSVPTSVYLWQQPPWSKCSVTCGRGVQRRRVWCEEDATRRLVADELCSDVKPLEVKDCIESPCATNNSVSIPSNRSKEQMVRWSAGPWSACDRQCGKGLQRRGVLCLDSRTNRTVSDQLCAARAPRPIDVHVCRFARCPRWRPGKWGACSTTCGQGIKNRTVTCQRGRRNQVNDTECLHKPKPITTTKCFTKACPTYKWVETPWSKCADPCRRGEQHRQVHCMTQNDQKAADRMCRADLKPNTTRQCSTDQCPYEWVPGPWNTCSQTCGNGTQIRVLECRLKDEKITSFVKLNELKHLSKATQAEPVVPRDKCKFLEQPATQQPCMINKCAADYYWRVGPWEECNATCGQGVRRRKVRCYDKNGGRTVRNNCEAVIARPRRQQPCFIRNCLPSTCDEIKEQNRNTHSIDGEYTVLLDGFAIKVYCHRMNETIPRTFIEVKNATNFAEIYGKRLVYPHTCPHNGERNDSCHCSEDGDANQGITYYSKIRVDLRLRKININDYSFATTPHGAPVPFATAGDCYSMKDCPQGKFSMDLRGTGLRIVDDLQWEDRGHRTTSRIDRTHNNALITGRCGGYCGRCAPEKFKGLVFEIDQSQIKTGGSGGL